MSTIFWSFCRKTCERLTVRDIVSFHSCASKANLALSLLATGGSWKKSPQMTTWSRRWSSDQDRH
jgi:hypothetical protein